MTLRLIPACLLLFAAAVRADPPKVDPYEQSDVVLEQESNDPSLAKIVLIAGRPSHGPGDHEFFAGCAILKQMLQQTPGVWPVMVRDGWPKDEKIFDGAKAVVFYLDGRGGHPLADPKKLGVIQKLIDQKCGFVCLHYAVDYRPQEGDRVINWMGGYYLDRFSINPHWDADFTSLPHHPITRGVKPFKIRDEWYYNMKFVPGMKNVTPILTATPPDQTRGTEDAKSHPGRPEVVAWAFERPDGGRGFGFTGGHTHKNWADADFRRLVTNAILWSAQIPVPEGGAKVEMDPVEIEKHLDRKGFNKPK
ncbi:MAG: ThuA domain-containing protein [Gemmataceae bacterium]